MQTMTGTTQSSRGLSIAGYVLSGLVVLFLLMDAVMKLLELPVVLQTTAELGYPTADVRTIGLLLLLCTALYAFPRTAVIGAVLLTAYLGGAVATHVRVENPLFSHVLFGVYLGVLLWGGLYLRDARVRELLPLRR
jgi:DoxX-like protein